MEKNICRIIVRIRLSWFQENVSDYSGFTRMLGEVLEKQYGENYTLLRVTSAMLHVSLQTEKAEDDIREEIQLASAVLTRLPELPSYAMVIRITKRTGEDDDWESAGSFAEESPQINLDQLNRRKREERRKVTERRLQEEAERRRREESRLEEEKKKGIQITMTFGEKPEQGNGDKKGNVPITPAPQKVETKADSKGTNVKAGDRIGHKLYKQGIVSKVRDDGIIEVDFNGNIKRFKNPHSFENGFIWIIKEEQ